MIDLCEGYSGTDKILKRVLPRRAQLIDDHVSSYDEVLPYLLVRAVADAVREDAERENYSDIAELSALFSLCEAVFNSDDSALDDLLTIEVIHDIVESRWPGYDFRSLLGPKSRERYDSV